MGIVMVKLLKTILAISCCVPLIALAHLPASQNQQNSIAPMLQKATPAVVNIFVEEEKLTRLDQLIQTKDTQTKVPVKSYAVGSGVIFDAAKGLIVTNAHVVKQAKLIIITLKDGQRYHAKLIAKDPGFDIAVLHIQAKNLTALPFADSDQVHVGDFVTAIGSSYGLPQTVTSGVVSAVNRSHPQIEGYQSFIQTDAPINPGNSGGALINMSGQLIGINTALVGPTDSNIGIGFAIPSNMVKSVINQLVKYGTVKRGALGVIAQKITPELTDALHLPVNQTGALISQVLPNTPAATAGLKPEDIITAVDQHPIHSAVQLRNVLGLIRPDTTINLTFLRDHKTQTVSLTVADPKKLQTPSVSYFGGMRLQDFNELEADGSQLHGVLITDISDASQGALAGLTLGDVITAVNKNPVTSVKTLQAACADQTKPLLLTVVRGNENLFVVLQK